MRFGAAIGSTLQRKCARFTCFRWEDSRKYLNEIIFTRDGAVPRCLHGLLFIQQKVNILENGSIRCGLQDLLDFTLKTAALKYDNYNNSRLLILQKWPVNPYVNQKKATYFKNRPWPKCTEKTNRRTVAESLVIISFFVKSLGKAKIINFRLCWS